MVEIAGWCDDERTAGLSLAASYRCPLCSLSCEHEGSCFRNGYCADKGPFLMVGTKVAEGICPISHTDVRMLKEIVSQPHGSFLPSFSECAEMGRGSGRLDAVSLPGD